VVEADNKVAAVDAATTAVVVDAVVDEARTTLEQTAHSREDYAVLWVPTCSTIDTRQQQIS